MAVRALPGRPDASGWTLAILRLIPYPARVSQSSRSLQFLLRIFAVPARVRILFAGKTLESDVDVLVGWLLESPAMVRRRAFRY